MSDLPCLTCGDSECGFAGTTIIRDDCNFSCYIPKVEDSMGDCSIDAMKPKAKTCGNCGHFMRDTDSKHLGICSVCYFEDADGTDVYRAVRDEQPCCLPLDCVERTDTLEQRYQQLEQVAKEMLDAIRISSSYRMSIKSNYYESFASQLEALGVSVDE